MYVSCDPGNIGNLKSPSFSVFLEIMEHAVPGILCDPGNIGNLKSPTFSVFLEILEHGVPGILCDPGNIGDLVATISRLGLLLELEKCHPPENNHNFESSKYRHMGKKA